VVKEELDIYTSLKVTQAILPVKVNYTPRYESNTDKNVCATTYPQKKFKGYKILNPYYLSLKRYGRIQYIDKLKKSYIILKKFQRGALCRKERKFLK
jgi:hypothetical protein